VTGYDLNGKRKQFEFTGLWLRIVHHELDHLLGLKKRVGTSFRFWIKVFPFRPPLPRSDSHESQKWVYGKWFGAQNPAGDFYLAC